MGIFHFPGDTHPFFLPPPALTRHFYDGYSLKSCVHPPFSYIYCLRSRCFWGGYSLKSCVHPPFSYIYCLRSRSFWGGYSLKNCVYPPFWLLYCICGQCSWGGYLPVFWKYPSHCYLSCKAPSVTTSVSTFVKSSVNHLSQILLDHRNKWPTPYFLEIMVETYFSCLPPPLKQRKRCVTIRKNRGGRAVLLFSTPLTTRKKASTDGQKSWWKRAFTTVHLP